MKKLNYELIVSIIAAALIGLVVGHYLGIREGSEHIIDMIAGVVGCWALLYALVRKNA